MPPLRPRRLLAASLGPALSLLRSAEGLLRQVGRRLSTLTRDLDLLRYRLRYEGSPHDVFIVTYPKSGTTWLQMILYQLTTDGSMDIPHIDAASPHLEERMVMTGREISELPGPLRIVKSHLPYDTIPKGPGRYIYCTRNGLDVAVSYFHHHRKFMLGEFWQPMDQFFGKFMKGEVPFGSWFEHVTGWLRNEDGLNLLVLSYEEMSADLEGAVRRIADFCGIAIDPAEMPRILERSSFAFMREHEAKFTLEWRGAEGGGDTAFIRKGRVGGWREELDGALAGEFMEACRRRLGGVDGERFRVLAGEAAAAPAPR